MTVYEIMSAEVATAYMDDTLEEIKEMFEQNHYHHMPILANYRLVGIISDRDVLRNLSPHVDSIWANNHDIITLKKRAHQIMTRNVVTISPEETVEKAAEIMLENSFGSLPVLDSSGAVVGIVTKTDLLESLCGKRSAAEK